ncbi:hypothetical protein DERF_007072 [Dermatophagoides farinae]|uniref:Uncharacterized protein n=1 Tax=Dermatophagoides farinae TaxID=6954 RepID=A0A922I0K9_DERFA|nr:hypothetical protein DERF_007072 [Dermatophagoides farinae]
MANFRVYPDKNNYSSSPAGRKIFVGMVLAGIAGHWLLYRNHYSRQDRFSTVLARWMSKRSDY